MSDNLKLAKECGIEFDVVDITAGGRKEAFVSEQQLESYTSRILASQQAAHDAEVARLKEEIERISMERHDAMFDASQQLSASQAREDELREKLEAAELALLNEGALHGETKMHLRNLEARIKASQEQEPCAWAYGVSAGDMYGITMYKDNHGLEPLYAQPPTQPELTELQRRIVELEAQLRK